MTPEAGWYPDPSGMAPLRFWDGHGWTDHTSAVPTASQTATIAPPALPAPPAFVAMPQAPYAGVTPWITTGQGVATRPYRRDRKRLYAIVGGVVAIAVIATAVPLALSKDSNKVPTTAQLKAVLLTNGEVGAIAGGVVTSAPDTDNSSDDDQTDCKDLTSDDSSDEKSDADEDYTGTGKFAEEDLSYTVGAKTIFAEVRQQLLSCHKMTENGASLSLSALPDPTVNGADETLAMKAEGTVSGVDVTVIVAIARFGNDTVEVTYGAPGAATDSSILATELLQAGAAKAKGSF